MQAAGLAGATLEVPTRAVGGTFPDNVRHTQSLGRAMNFELLDSLGWRAGLIALIVLLLSYIVVMFVRMRRLQNELNSAAVPPLVAQSAVAAYAGIQEPEATGAPPAPAAGEAAQAVEPAPSATPAVRPVRIFTTKCASTARP